jgi:hypothetical protein
MESPKNDSQGTVGMAGCGLGSMIIDKNEKWAQVASSLLNGTGMQSFAISFGTSNCTEDGVVEASSESTAYIESNYANIQRDLANGSGEYLDGLVNAYGCQGQSASNLKAVFLRDRAQLLKSNPSTAVSDFNRVVPVNAC